MGPGFVDLQVNGFIGVDFSAPGLTVEGVARVVHALRERGTAAFCPTVITSPPEIYEEVLPVLAEASRSDDLATSLLGIHLEGPFISSRDGARGAHAAEHTRPPDPALYDHFFRLADGQVSLVTVAPELPGAVELIRHILDSGARVSLGHHLATLEQIELACEAGAGSVTHFGNGIPNLMARHPNPLWDQLATEDLVIMIITDGHHLPPSLIRSVILARGSEGTIVVSDANPMGGLPPGTYHALGQTVVLEPGGKLWNPVGNHLAGSSYCLLECVNYLAGLGGLDETRLRRVAIENPLRLLGLGQDRLAETGVNVEWDGRRFRVAS